jgi:hypothetical protein
VTGKGHRGGGGDCACLYEPSVTVELGQRSINALADAIAHRLGARTEHDDVSLVTARELAHRLGRTADWVRRHQGELGAVRLGSGPRPRLLFDPRVVAERVSARSGSESLQSQEHPAYSPKPRGRSSRSSGTTTQLLPFRGSERLSKGPEPGA